MPLVDPLQNRATRPHCNAAIAVARPSDYSNRFLRMRWVGVRMRRREFMTGIGGIMVTVPIAARAQQQSKIYRVAFVGAGPPVSRLLEGPVAKAFVQGLRELGYVEGKNLILEWRSAEGRYERFPEIFRELVSLKVDVLVTVTREGTKAAKDATQTIPIVIVAVTDPVAHGLVHSLGRPGGNVTGSSDDTGLENALKRLQLLKELLPGMSRVACLSMSAVTPPEEANSLKAAAEGLGVKVLFAEHSPTDYTGAFAFIARERPDALFVTKTGANFANRRSIVEFAANSRLPAIYPHREYVAVGGLVAYGMEAAELFRRAASHVDRILNGTKPSELPVEQPAKLELVINLKAAKALGLSIPSTLLARADEVIE